MTRLETLQTAVQTVLGDLAKSVATRIGEITVVVSADHYLEAATKLRDDPALKFGMLIDLCGMDYLSYREGEYDGLRFAAVSHLLSIEHNWRLRLRAYCPDDDFPMLPSLHEIWPAVAWFEREAFDLYGILFDNHPDLRRLLTDYGFVGHPFRKDFPVTGYVEMHYDTEQKRVAYRPVTIEPRENVPRIIREDGYGKGR